MTNPVVSPPTRIFTTWGTVLYVDPASRELRHGPIDGSPENAFFLADPRPEGSRPRGCLALGFGESAQAIACQPERSLALGESDEKGQAATATMLTVVDLERGLVGLEANGTFLSAEPDGRITLSKSWCSLWEFFLLSEDLAGAPGDAAGAKDHVYAGFEINKKWLHSYIVDPRLRVRVKKNSKAKKLLIYGYPRWSHGRVYYDLCRHLWDRGYIVDILNWQVSHAAYFGEFASFYDVFITALDGVGGLVNNYGVAYERIIGLSHHELDIRMLIEQKGLEAFDKLANYGVVSEFLYSRSLMLGVPRIPKVALPRHQFCRILIWRFPPASRRSVTPPRCRRRPMASSGSGASSPRRPRARRVWHFRWLARPPVKGHFTTCRISIGRSMPS